MMKKITPRNKDYLDYIREMPSCVDGEGYFILGGDGDTYQSIAHHVRLGNLGGVGLKPSDYRTIPMTQEQHQELHNSGEITYYEKTGIDSDFLIMSYLMGYLHRLVDKKQVDAKDAIRALEDAVEGLR